MHVVHAPTALLLDPELPASCKVLWLALQGDVRPTALKAASGLAYTTIRSGMAILSTAGWHPVKDKPATPTVPIPIALLADRRLRSQAKVLFGALQLTPHFHNTTGQFTYVSLGALTNTCRSVLKEALSELKQAGWLTSQQKNQFAPLHFSLVDPTTTFTKADLVKAMRRIQRAPFRGEALMREYLSLLIDSDQFADDSAPGFLENPLTGERLEFDRFYPPNVAFEFNGPQHYGATNLFSAEEATQQQARDYMKIGICITRGISLVIVHAQDLSLKGMQAKVGNLLPLRDLHGYEPLIKNLEALSRRYRKTASEGSWSETPVPKAIN